jgi:hypothetical protein
LVGWKKEIKKFLYNETFPNLILVIFLAYET